MNIYIATAWRIVLIVAFSIFLPIAFIHAYYFTCLFLAILILFLTLSFFRVQSRIYRKVDLMIKNISYGGLNFSFSSRVKGVEGKINKEMSEALSTFQNKLQVAIASEAETEAWQKLIRVLTHEIMNSLTPIISISDTLTDCVRPQTEEEYFLMQQAIQTIRKRSLRLLYFVENYRKMTRIGLPKKQNISIKNLLEPIIRLYRQENIAITFECCPPNLRISVDPVMIEQLIINLIKNSAEAMHGIKEPKIGIKCFLAEGSPVMEISDNGNGIIPEAMERIFVPFYTTKKEGSGIGLNLCRQIMVQHQGSITIESAVDAGTTVKLTFSRVEMQK